MKSSISKKPLVNPAKPLVAMIAGAKGIRQKSVSWKSY
jgi:hypothetical protein